MQNTLLKKYICCFFLLSLTICLYGKTLIEIDPPKEICSSAPTMQCPSTVWLKPNGNSLPDRTGMPTVQSGSSDCLEPIITYTDEVEIINSCHRNITRTWRAEAPEDPSLFTICVQTIKMIDEINPTVGNPPQNITRYTNSGGCRQAVSWPSLEIFDNYIIDYIDITGTRNGLTFPVENGGMFDEGITVVTYTIVDFCANVTIVSFEVNIMCATCFVECPPNACLPVGSDVSPDVLGYATSFSGNENCGSATFEYEDMMLETGCNGVSTSVRMWSAVFQTMPNLEFTCSQRIELKDENELTIYNCPEDINVRNAFTPVYWEDPVALNGSEITYLTVSHPSGSFFPFGITNVTYTATDVCGNKTTCTFKVSVLNDDTIDCQNDITTSCDGDGTATVDWVPPVYDGDCNECPKGKPISGFIYVGSLNGSNYYCSRHNYNYTQAKKAAEKYGGYIASIGSKEENDYLAAHIGSATALIGLTDIEKEGTFTWDSGEDLTFEDWFTAQPNDANRNQDAVELMRSGEWNDISITDKREFVLEVPCEFVTQIEGPTPETVLEPGIYSVVYRIADGCGYEKYCAFDISITPGITLSCVEDIIVEIPIQESGTVITWEDLEYSSCCDNCNDTNDCVELELVAGLPSGGMFTRDETTTVVYRATDNCDNSRLCMFNVTIGTKAGSRNHVVLEQDHAAGPELTFETEVNPIDEPVFVPIAEEDKLVLTTEKLYPNPSYGSTVLEIPNYQNLSSVSVYSVDGMLISDKKNNFSLRQNIDTASWQSGIYFIRLMYNGSTVNTLRLSVY